MKNDPKRATGRTTGLILQALGKAVENPGTYVEVINHNPQNIGQRNYCVVVVEMIAKKLHLDVSVDVRLRDNLVDYGVFIKSNWVSPYSQRTPAEKKWKEIYGVYPNELESTDDFNSWKSFKIGFEASQND